MTIQHWYRVCALALLIAACGDNNGAANCGDGVCGGSETAGSCAADCGCGNGIANAGEECDGADLGGGTCMDAVGRGGTLGCNADCTFDTTGCTLGSCGNGVIDDGEACDGAALGGSDCTDIGFVGGDLTCSMDCVYDTATCCMNTCATEGISECVGDVVRECTLGAAGCRAWEVTDCAAAGDVCETDGSAATCVCVDRCTAGETRCEGSNIVTCQETAAGCLDWITTTECGATNGTCAAAASGPSCVSAVSADTCAAPLVLAAGSNAVAWNAVDADYLTAASCDASLVGPDLVLSYTAPERGFVRIAMDKPTQRQVMVVSAAACGTTTPEVACSSGTASTLSSEFPVSMGTTYYVYVRDTSSGTAPLPNPLFVTVEETLCSSLGAITPTLSPANGTNVPDRAPVLTVNLQYPINPNAGVVTLTGSLGTSRSFDLATTPEEVVFTNGGRTMIIDPGVVFPLDEIVTVTWTGLLDASCDVEIPSPTWSFVITGPLCGPGKDGMVGNTVTRVVTGQASFTEYHVAADSNPTGYVYVGGTSALHRFAKAGGAREDVEASAGLIEEMLGYDMIVAGNEIYTLESTTSLTSNVLWRLSTDGGSTWNLENYVQFPMLTNDDLRAITHHEGRLYMATHESTDGTEIWSVAAGVPATMLPQQPILEATIDIEEADSCSGIAVDDAYYYLACSTGDRLIRIDRVTFETRLITSTINLSSTKNSIVAHDLGGDGTADVLYVSSDAEDVRYVCDPAGGGPFFVDTLATFGSATTTSNYGLSFDPLANVLWMFDDDTRELIKIQ